MILTMQGPLSTPLVPAKSLKSSIVTKAAVISPSAAVVLQRPAPLVSSSSGLPGATKQSEPITLKASAIVAAPAAVAVTVMQRAGAAMPPANGWQPTGPTGLGGGGGASAPSKVTGPAAAPQVTPGMPAPGYVAAGDTQIVPATPAISLPASVPEPWGSSGAPADAPNVPQSSFVAAAAPADEGVPVWAIALGAVAVIGGGALLFLRKKKR